MSAERSKKTTESATSKKQAKAANAAKAELTASTKTAKKSVKAAEPSAEKKLKKSADVKTTDAKTDKTVTKSRTTSSKKTAGSAKSVGKKASKAKGDQDRGGETSSKTPQVMRLVEQRNDMVNPTIMAGKSSIPRQLRGLEPLTKIMKREAEAVFGTDEDAETFNLTALVIDDNAAPILRRFNACDCEICIEQLSRLTADSVPARFAKLKRRSVERKAPEVEELKAPLKRAVTSRMIRLVMQNKRRSFHDI